MNYPKRIVKKGEADKSIVKAVQKRLNAVGCGPLGEDGDFGNKTFMAVKQFQSNRLDQFGQPLIIDGQIGAITWWVLFGGMPGTGKPNDPLLAKALDIAQANLGVKETPPNSNRGPEVENFLHSVGRNPGDAWCAAFVYWCFDEAAKSLGLQNPLHKTGHCLTHWNNTKGRKIAKNIAQNDISLVRPGQIFIIKVGTKGNGHTGIVTKVEGGFIHTIEGNTNPGHSSEGLGVFQLKRKINTISAGFIDYSE